MTSRLRIVPLLATGFLAAFPLIGIDARQQSPPAGIVRGRVVDPNQRPIRFADVQFSSAATEGTVSSHYSTRTAIDGTFEFINVKPGRYYLAARSAVDPLALFPTLIEVSGGDVVNGLSIVVRKGGVITGRVTDESGSGISVPVTVQSVGRPADLALGTVETFTSLVQYRASAPDLMPAPFSSTPSWRSDADGNYRIYGLTPGEYLVMASPSPDQFTLADGRRYSYAPIFFPNTTNPADATTVTVAAGEERAGVDLTMRLVPLSTVSGSLMAPDRVEDFPSIDLVQLGRELLRLSPRSARASGGRFRIEGVPPGAYWIMSTTLQQPADDAPAGMSAQRWWAMTPITVSGQDVDGVSLTLHPPMTLSGQLVKHTDGDQTISVSACVVTLLRFDNSSPGFSTQQVGRPDAQGRFTIRNVLPGRYRLRVTTGNSIPVSVVSAMATDRQLINAEIDVVPGTNIDQLVIRVRR